MSDAEKAAELLLFQRPIQSSHYGMGSHCLETHLRLILLLQTVSCTGLRPHCFADVVGKIPRCVRIHEGGQVLRRLLKAGVLYLPNRGAGKLDS